MALPQVSRSTIVSIPSRKAGPYAYSIDGVQKMISHNPEARVNLFWPGSGYLVLVTKTNLASIQQAWDRNNRILATKAFLEKATGSRVDFDYTKGQYDGLVFLVKNGRHQGAPVVNVKKALERAYKANIRSVHQIEWAHGCQLGLNHSSTSRIDICDGYEMGVSVVFWQ